MAHRSAYAGFTLVEVLIAVVLLSVIALGLSSTLVSAQRARASSENWMRATQLAAQGMEQLRAGHALTPLDLPNGFSRSSSAAPWNGHARLDRLEVTVTWNDLELHSFQLVTLARR